MNSSIYKLCFNTSKYFNTKQSFNIQNKYLLFSSNNRIIQKKIIIRTVLTRPKELDLLRERTKKKVENDYEGTTDSDKNIGPSGYFLLTVPIITFGLGIWQIRRRKEKLELIKNLQERTSRQPVELPENLNELVQMEYYPIKVKGEFLHDNEFLIGPKNLILDGQLATEGKGTLISGISSNRGYYLITPFRLENRDMVILINRGWVPYKYKNPEERKKCHREGIIELTGINRLNETRPQFMPKNNPEKDMWHYRDIYQMAEFAETEPVYLEMIESDPDPGMPIGSQTRINLRNEHLSYIITWFGLSAATGFLWFRQFIKKKPLV